MSEPVITSQTISGIQTGVARIGEGIPVIALHGWQGSIKSFWPVAERLAPLGYEVHVLDLPGFGQSELPPGVWSVGDYTRFVIAYLDQAGLDRVALLGHSFGGRIGLVLAADYADRVSKMVLADSAGIKAALPLKNRIILGLWRALNGTLEIIHANGLRDRLRARFYRRFASEDYQNAGPLRDTFRQVIQENLAPYAQRIKAPTVLIWGDQDADTPLWQGRKLEQLIPDAGLVVFKGAGHFAYLDRLNDYIRVVDHFLKNGS
ncbi:MAG TPA: alpha/beta hydrolase [Aggregatilineaceae bacterium]|nr:alpha/beta hydrolase [Aggregatilineaceae bacterium]